MPEIVISKVQTARDRHRFVRFPWRLYRPAAGRRWERWVPPLLAEERVQFDRRRNSWFRQGEEEDFLAFRAGRLVGRVSACVDHGYVNFQKDQSGFVGFFECENDPEAAAALLAAAEAWLKAKGMAACLGPINQSTNQTVGCQIDGFDSPPVVYMGWNPPYYDELFRAGGYAKVKDLVSYRMTTELELSPKIQRVAGLCRGREGVSIRTLDRAEFGRIVETIRDIYNEAWAGRWGFVPWTREQFEQLAKDLRRIIEPELVLVAEIGGEAVGFALPIPDINHILARLNGRRPPFGFARLLTGPGRVTVLRVAAFAVRPKYRNRGIDALFISELYHRGLRLGYRGAEFSWVLEDNRDLRNLLENWGATLYKTHRIYRKELQ